MCEKVSPALNMGRCLAQIEKLLAANCYHKELLLRCCRDSVNDSENRYFTWLKLSTRAKVFARCGSFYNNCNITLFGFCALGLFLPSGVK